MARPVTVGLALVVPCLAVAAPGDLDPRFGTRGVVVSVLASNVGGLGVQPDG